MRRIVAPTKRDRCVTIDNIENGNSLAAIVRRPRAKGYDILADGGRVGSLNYTLTRVFDRGGDQVARIKEAGLRFWIAIETVEPLDEPFASVAIMAALCRDLGPGPGGG